MITLVSLAQSLSAETGILGNELVLRGGTTGFEVRVPVTEAALEQVSKLVQAESGVSPRLAEEPSAPSPEPAQMRVTTDELVGQRPQQPEEDFQTYEQFEIGDDDDAIELAAIGEI